MSQPKQILKESDIKARSCCGGGEVGEDGVNIEL